MTQQDGNDDLGPGSEFGMAAGKALGGKAGFGDRPDLDGLPAVRQGLGDAPTIGLDEAVRHATATVKGAVERTVMDVAF